MRDLDRLISNIQFDHWVVVGATPVCTVMSHPDVDHHPQYCMMYSPPIVVSNRFSDVVSGSIVKVWPDSYERYDGMFFWLLHRVLIDAQKPNVFRDVFHADWWYITDSESGLLFIGDLYYPEVKVIELTANYIVERAGRPLDVVLLPSYGGVAPPLHEVPAGSEPTLLAGEIGEVAERLKAAGVKVGGLPHPVKPSWSDFDFIKLPARRRET